MIPFGELKTQFKGIENEIRCAIDEVFESGWFILGRQVQAFEEEFAAYLGVKHVVGVGSGTDALHLALRAVGVGPGDEVVTAANTCVPTVSAISACGARPALVDCDPGTLTIGSKGIAKALTPRTRAIIPVHLYGHPCDMGSIIEAANGNAIPIIEDCAQAHGSEYRGVKCGRLGRAAAFSFYPSKNLGAYGDGGAVATDDPELARKVRMMRNYGEEKRYYHTVEGFNSRLDELQAAILRVKLRHLDEWNEARRARAREYCRRLEGLPVRPVHEAPWAKHIYHLFVIRSPERDRLQDFLKTHGVGTLIHYPVPMHLQAAYAVLGLGRGAFPNAERACAEVLSLPMYPELSFEAIAYIADRIAAFHGR